MTSPAQLKYLDAMGIPVWVSRDLVSEQNPIELGRDIIENTTTQVVVSETPTSNPNEVGHNHNQANSAQNILNSLNSSTDRPRFNAESSQAAAGIEKELHQSVDRTKIPVERPAEKLNASQLTVSDSPNFLSQTPQHYIFAKGNEAADWLVIGHSPEPFTGIGNEPFAGEAGILLNNMLMAVGLEYPHQQSYIVNILDVNQSTQSTDHSHINLKLKLKQKLNSIVDKVKPKVVFLVGQNAAQTMLDSDDPLIIMRSKVHTIGESNIPCVVSYYPSYLLQKPIDKRKAWNDLKLAKSTVVDDS